jgi:hydrogenase expression/formation protein HypE
MQKNITLAMGNGGEENNELIKEISYKAFKKRYLGKK